MEIGDCIDLQTKETARRDQAIPISRYFKHKKYSYKIRQKGTTLQVFGNLKTKDHRHQTKETVMGLDQYAHVRINKWNPREYNFEWRKHSRLQQFMMELWHSKKASTKSSTVKSCTSRH